MNIKNIFIFGVIFGWEKGLEPSTHGSTIRYSNQLSYTHHVFATAKIYIFFKVKRFSQKKILSPLFFSFECTEGIIGTVSFISRKILTFN